MAWFFDKGSSECFKISKTNSFIWKTLNLIDESDLKLTNLKTKQKSADKFHKSSQEFKL